MNQNEKQLRAARRMAEHVAEHLDADLSLKLWDGTIVPLGPGARRDILIAIRSPAVVRKLIFSPGLMTLVELYASGDLDIEGGTPLEAVRRWDHLKAVRLGRKLDKRLVLASLWPFLRAGEAGSAAAAAAGFQSTSVVTARMPASSSSGWVSSRRATRRLIGFTAASFRPA